jgi:hypothetical protein
VHSRIKINNWEIKLYGSYPQFSTKKMAGVILWDTFWQEEDFLKYLEGNF